MLNLTPGTYTFKFEVDGEWKYDPECAFTSDEYGNIVNFIEVIEKEGGEPQIPTKSILRDANFELPAMNPDATEAAQRVKENFCRSDELEYALDVQAGSDAPDETKPFTLRGINRTPSLTNLDILGHTSPIGDAPNVPPSPEHNRPRGDSTSVLLAANTEHFGGDLVTQEHQSRVVVNSLLSISRPSLLTTQR